MKKYPDKISTLTTESVKIFANIEGDMQITDSNAAFFDAANSYKGCIVGLHEVLQRQGLMEGWTPNEDEVPSPGQKKEVDPFYEADPDLNDDDFWLRTRIIGCL